MSASRILATAESAGVTGGIPGRIVTELERQEAHDGHNSVPIMLMDGSNMHVHQHAMSTRRHPL
jgi:hypothetical protein